MSVGVFFFPNSGHNETKPTFNARLNLIQSKVKGLLGRRLKLKVLKTNRTLKIDCSLYNAPHEGKN